MPAFHATVTVTRHLELDLEGDSLAQAQGRAVGLAMLDEERRSGSAHGQTYSVELEQYEAPTCAGYMAPPTQTQEQEET